MNLLRRLLGAGLLIVVIGAFAQTNTNVWFQFDAPDEVVPSTLLENPFAYDAGIAATDEGLWLTWLEFVPGKGDELWVGLRGKKGWKSKTKVSSEPGEYAKPTVFKDGEGKIWLTYERLLVGDWGVRVFGPWTNSEMAEASTFDVGPGINHSTVPVSSNLVWIFWQARYSKEQFQVYARAIMNCKYSYQSDYASYEWTKSVEGNAWHPRGVAVKKDLYLVWDAYDGDNYNILFRAGEPTRISKPYNVDAVTCPSHMVFRDMLAITTNGSFEAHAQIAAGKHGKLWVSWEEDGENWGKRYTARLPGRRVPTLMTDKVGPLHRFRKLHLATMDEKGRKLTEYEIPQLSFEIARARTNAPDGLRDFGAFYENAQLVVDGKERPWIVYRHYYAPWIGTVTASHKQEDMRVYARCLLADGWSKLYSFKQGQGDGMQRISVSAMEEGIAVAWTVGRTDRRTSTNEHGVAFAQIKLGDAKAVMRAKSFNRDLQVVEPKPIEKVPERSWAEGRKIYYQLYFGDLHRHTDISLCYSPADGTIEDAYRYAIDVAPLDFLGITDHTHDLQMGKPLAHIWWRSRKEVARHALGERFIPFYSYERSRGDTDHNVISLRDDMLRPHTYPLPQFWKELDTNTITIPHQPFNSVLWKNTNNTHRTLLEVYQGCRNTVCEDALQEGLRGGHRVGVIASSDHLSTSASFACVWAEEATRESIFRAMQARRTYGATARIFLKVTANEYWMGEEFKTDKPPKIDVEVAGTADVVKLELILDGKIQATLTPSEKEVHWNPPLPPSLKGKHIVYVRLEQADGNRAWSSPLWMEIGP